MKDQPNLLAVYGTLRRGGPANGLLRDAKYVRQSVIAGAMYNMGPFPAYKRHMAGFKPILVDLYQIPNEGVLSACDRYEGYRPNKPDESLYTRIRQLTIDNEACWVWVYEYNGTVNTNDEIKSGDWFNP